ncbi:MAG: RIP metalloprotease RseP [Schleiferiaceae bacterium]|nr:RIP metalloprotease RseP [Schleiferiaceae bacterium]
MDIWIKAAQFILSLSILIVLHEFGHFLPAKLFKVRVEKFYLFFDPYFSLLKKKIGETVYGIGWLPLGGYVKLAGMVDESMDKEQLAEEPKEWEFRSKPAWQRLIIMVGGVLVNFILAIIIYAGILAFYGQQFLSNDAVIHGVQPSPLAKEMGFQAGDKIHSINGMEPEKFFSIPGDIMLEGKGQVQVLRNGNTEAVYFDEVQIGKMIAQKDFLFQPRLPYVVANLKDSSVASVSGLEVGDSIVAFNGHEMLFFDQYLDSIPTYAGREVALGVYRNKQFFEYRMEVPSDSVLGIAVLGNISRFYKLDTVNYSLFNAIPAGFSMSVDVLTKYVRQFKLIFNSKTGAYKEVGGLIMIADQFPSYWDWRNFWEFTAFLSVMLGFLNILPIPALDGGHIVFVLWEMITGRKPSTKVLEYAQVVGFVILMALLLLANGNDVLRLFK